MGDCAIGERGRGEGLRDGLDGVAGWVAGCVVRRIRACEGTWHRNGEEAIGREVVWL